MKSRLPLFILIITLLTSITLHWKIFSTDLLGVHLWRQIQNQWNVRNFYRIDNNILNPRISAYNLGQDGNILRYEFPLLQWSIAQVQSVFGESISVTRISMFIIGFIGVLGFYYFIRLLFKDQILAACGAWVFNFSPLFYYYTMNPLSDIPAMTAQIWLMVFAIKYYKDQKLKDLVYSSILMCLAGLFKLPYVVFGILPLTAVILIYRDQKKSNPDATKKLIKSLFILSVFSIPVAAWYIYVIRSWVSMGVLSGILGSTEWSSIPGFIQFHLTYWLPRYLINPVAVILLITGLLQLLSNKPKTSGPLILLISGALAGLAYYVYEINMISTVHDYYLLPFLVFIHLLVIFGLKPFFKNTVARIMSVLLLLSMPVIAYLEINDYYWHIDRNGYNKDWFVYKQSLNQAVADDALCIFLNDNTGVVFPYEVDKQGYVFDKDELPTTWIADMIINHQVQFMYSDSRKVDSSIAVQPYIDSLILQQGSVKVFQLVKPEDIPH